MIKKIIYTILYIFVLVAPFSYAEEERIVGLEPDNTSVVNEELRALDIDNQIQEAGKLDLNSKKIENLATPTASTDAATKGYVDTIIPSGVILMWSGTVATIPSGWVLCNGSNGTPDLRDKFIVGAKQDSGGVAKTNITGSLLQSGGANTHTHEVGSFAGPSHTHTGPSHTHTISGGGAYTYNAATSTAAYIAITSGEDSYYSSRPSTQDFTSSASGTGATGTEGSGAVTGTSASGTAIPTFYALCFIQKT